jgi:hypothetical protein
MKVTASSLGFILCVFFLLAPHCNVQRLTAQHYGTPHDGITVSAGPRDALSQPEVLVVEAPLLLIIITTEVHHGMRIELALLSMKGAQRV